MRYPNITRAVFLERINRFVAAVEMDGRRELVHVKNTGRCGEILLPGAEIYLTAPGTEGRKYRYDLVAARKGNGLLINVDSQAPNRVAAEWLATQEFDRIIPEYSWGNSRMDFCLERSDQQGGQQVCLLEVKGCTLERDGIGYFPDAPTQRGVRHIRELIRARQQGLGAALAFVIQMDGVREVRAEQAIHPDFHAALQDAEQADVRILDLCCHVEPDALWVVDCIGALD